MRTIVVKTSRTWRPYKMAGRKIIPAILLALVLSTSPSLRAQSVIEQDSLALVALYNGTNGPNWAASDGWLTAAVDSWLGIGVRDSRVVEIRLHPFRRDGSPISISVGLDGPLPAELGDLDSLEVLNLYANKITGIPAEIEQLTALKTLNLNENNLSGRLPPEIAGLVSLEGLSLANNNIVGPLPIELSQLPSLKFLDLRNNSIGGSFPAELFDLENLEGLELNGNGLTGEIPSGLSKLKRLRYFSVFANHLEGPIPEELGGVHDQMYHIDLSLNNFTGPIPRRFGSLSQLSFLHLGSNDLTGSIPPELGNLTELRILMLYRNRLTGPIPDELTNLSNLTHLNFQSNGLRGALSVELATFLSTIDNCSLEGHGIYLCIPETSEYQAIGANPICSLPLRSTCAATVSVSEETPFKTSLHQNYPNPFNPTTIIEFDLAKVDEVLIFVTNTMGQEVRRVLLNDQSQGRNSYSLSLEGLPSGRYFYTLTTGGFSDTKSMLLIR